MDKHYDIRILLDGTGFTEVTQHRTVVAVSALDRITGKLGKRHDRNLKFLRSSFQRPGNGRDLLFTHASKFARALHELKIIDDYESHALGLDQSLGLRPELHD